MHVRAVQVIFFVPTGSRKDNVGIKCRSIHAEVDIHNQVKLAFGGVFAPCHFVEGILIHFFRNDLMMSAQIMPEKVFLSLGAGIERIAAPDEPQTGPVFRRVRILDSKL